MLESIVRDFQRAPFLLPLLLILIGVPLAFWGTTQSAADIWISNETFTHGFLILPITLWLIWGQRDTLASIPVSWDTRALFLVLPLLAFWGLSTLTDIAAFQQLAVVGLIASTVALILGKQLFLALLFPLAYLFFAVPLGQSLIPPMMEFTADFTVYMVQLSGVPIFRDGLSFQLPTGNWSVVEECSGVRYLIASAALGTIYAYITYTSLTKRTVFIIASLIVPIVANGIRAYGIVMIGHFSGMKYAVGVDHLLYGWVFFGVVIFALFWVGGFWADEPVPVAKEKAYSDKSGTTNRNIVLVLIAFAVYSIFISQLAKPSITLSENASFDLPTSLGIWVSAEHEPSSSEWRPVFRNPDLSATERYTNSSASELVDIHIAYYDAQRDGAEAISSLNQLTDPYEGDWKLIASRDTEKGNDSFKEAEVTRPGQKRLVWRAYWVDGQYVASPYIAKLLEVKQMLTGNQHAMFLTISTPVISSTEEARLTIDSAWKVLRAPIADTANAIAKAN